MLMALGHVEGPSMIQVYSISCNVKGILLYPNSLKIGHVGYTEASDESLHLDIFVHPGYKKVCSILLLLNENKHDDNQYL